jgi:hypothetical protein
VESARAADGPDHRLLFCFSALPDFFEPLPLLTWITGSVS